MSITVKLRYLRIAPRKVRLVAKAIKGKKVEEAETILRFLVKRAAKPMAKLLRSAIATAEKDFNLKKSNLFISKILVDEGPKLKRWRYRAKGRVYPIEKKTSHITLVLKEIKEKETKVKKDKSK